MLRRHHRGKIHGICLHELQTIQKWNGHPLDDNPVALVVKLADSSRKPKRSVSDSNSALFSDMITAQRIDLPPTGLQPRGGSFDAVSILTHSSPGLA